MPGAGSTKGANWFQEQKAATAQSCSAPPALPSSHTSGRSARAYEYNDWNPVMASGTGGVAYLNAEAGRQV